MNIALYRRYRPDTFNAVIGQEHVTDPLKAALDSGRINHAYLFSGPRGCGKTTSARIMARCMNCAQGPTSTPCGECDSCQELATGGSGSLDVVEIDAASHNGVDDARELRERATFAPVRDRYKIFILDEAHMVTSQGFNALLKLVEEPPEHVKFIFATTEPDKVIGTIRSRTHHYPFRLVAPDTLEKYLKQLCQAEKVQVEPGVFSLVIRAGGGSVRDTLSVLDQLIAGTNTEAVSYQHATALLGYTDENVLENTVRALIEKDAGTLFQLIEKTVDAGHDPRRFAEDLLLRLRDLLVLSLSLPKINNPELLDLLSDQDGTGSVTDLPAALQEQLHLAAQILPGLPQSQLSVMVQQSQQWPARLISLCADLTNQGVSEMTGATAPRLQIELLAARLLMVGERIGTSAENSRPVDNPDYSRGRLGANPQTAGQAPATGTGSGNAAMNGAAMARAALAQARSQRTVSEKPSAPAGPIAPVTSISQRPSLTVMPTSSSAPAAKTENDSSAGHIVERDGQPVSVSNVKDTQKQNDNSEQVNGSEQIKSTVQVDDFKLEKAADQLGNKVQLEGEGQLKRFADQSKQTGQAEVSTPPKMVEEWQLLLRSWPAIMQGMEQKYPAQWSQLIRWAQIGYAQENTALVRLANSNQLETLREAQGLISQQVKSVLGEHWQVELVAGQQSTIPWKLSEWRKADRSVLKPKPEVSKNRRPDIEVTETSVRPEAIAVSAVPEIAAAPAVTETPATVALPEVSKAPGTADAPKGDSEALSEWAAPVSAVPDPPVIASVAKMEQWAQQGTTAVPTAPATSSVPPIEGQTKPSIPQIGKMSAAPIVSIPGEGTTGFDTSMVAEKSAASVASSFEEEHVGPVMPPVGQESTASVLPADQGTTVPASASVSAVTAVPQINETASLQECSEIPPLPPPEDDLVPLEVDEPSWEDEDAPDGVGVSQVGRPVAEQILGARLIKEK